MRDRSSGAWELLRNVWSLFTWKFHLRGKNHPKQNLTWTLGADPETEFGWEWPGGKEDKIERRTGINKNAAGDKTRETVALLNLRETRQLELRAISAWHTRGRGRGRGGGWLKTGSRAQRPGAGAG